MDRIIIHNIEMPRVRAVRVGGEEVCTVVQMASGRTVKEMQGHRTTITAEWDWLPVDTITALVSLLRQGGYFMVQYPDPDGTDKSGMFDISQPELKVFRYVDGIPRWHGVSLTMRSQEVT